MKVMSRPTMLTWAMLLALPLILGLVVQMPLCTVAVLSDFFEGLPPLRATLLLTAVFALPGYGVIAWRFVTLRQRVLHGVVLTLVYVVYLPLVWIAALHMSRAFFMECVA